MLQQQQWRIFRVAFLAAAMLSAGNGIAQVLTPDLPQNRALILMEEQYQQAHYSLAAQSARGYLDAPAEKLYGKRQADLNKAKYYLALSGLKADIPGCADAAQQAMKEIDDVAYDQRIAFTLAQYYFHKEQLVDAIPLYEETGISNLNNTEIADAKFELAYCYFNNRQFDKAEPLLLSIKEIKDGKYYMAGNYYYGLLVYNENKYKEALKSFDRIKDAKEYRSVVPYYIAEIYYFMGNRAKAQQQADTILKGTEKSYYDNELHLLMAQCLFEDQRYAEARPYFEYYYEHATKIRKEDMYEMAYCDYRLNEWASAIDKFKMLNNANDSLGQTAMYLLGDCYLKTNDMQSARNAFGICADMTFNAGQQEASMIVYSKISYEMGYNDEALRQLNNLLKTFPRTQYKDEANTLISGLLVKTGKYAEALSHLETVSQKDKNYRDVYQKANFGYAIEQFRAGDHNMALTYFDLSLKYPFNAAYEAAAFFWKGELSYRLRHYNEAISYSKEFLDSKANKTTVEHISPLATVQHAYLNMGFAAMDMQNYSAAQGYFSQAQEVRSKDVYSGQLATLREADAVFMQRGYNRAITLYDKIIAINGADADYASYQKGIILGLTGKNTEKINVLQALVNKMPPSAYANSARYEMAVTYMDADKYPQALTNLQALTEARDKSYAPKAWMKMGFIYQQTDDDNKAITAYKHVVIDYPASEDRLPAMDALKNLYIQSNQPGAYARMLKENHLPSAESSAIDSTYYAAAEAQYGNSKWDQAKAGFDAYLDQYPNGIFAVKAHYYRAESNYRLKNYKDAMPDYSSILAGPVNDFYENSARHAANIAYADKDYTKAFDYYLKLSNSTQDRQVKELAYNGLMNSAYYSEKYNEASLYADSVLAILGVSLETSNSALYYKAKSLQRFDSGDAALKVYKQLSANKSGEIAAESRYHVAELLLKQGNLKAAEDAANESIRQSAGFDYWIVKSYILLSDVLVKGKDYFNAKATLESIVKHTKIAELKQEASKKLDEVRVMEKQKSKLSEE